MGITGEVSNRDTSLACSFSPARRAHDVESDRLGATCTNDPAIPTNQTDKTGSDPMTDQPDNPLGDAVAAVGRLAELARKITDTDNDKADRSTYKNLATAPPSADLVAHAVDPQQLCGTCLHRRERHTDDTQCRHRDPQTGEQCGCTTFLDGPADIEDPTRDPRVEQLPAVTTSMSPDQFKAWLAAEGDLFVVYLPGNQSFVIKVPEAHNAFFVAMMQQVRFCLGPEVKAVRMMVATGPPAELAAAEYAPGADPNEYAKFAKAPPEEYAPGEPRKVKCAGSGDPPEGSANGRNMPGRVGRGRCSSCRQQYKLTGAGNVRVHYLKA